MTTFTFVSDLLLLLVGLLLIIVLVNLVIMGLQITRSVMQMMQQVKPVVGKAKRLAGIGKALSVHVGHSAGEIKDEVNHVTEDVTRRARGIGWLYRRTLLAPAFSLVASIIGIRRDIRIMRMERQARVRRRRTAKMPQTPVTIRPREAPIVEEEPLRKAA